MFLLREGLLREQDPSRGDILSLCLNNDDVSKLADPDQRYTMARFMQFERPVAGWAPEDKVHVRLEDVRLSVDEAQLATLTLDPGGDLYFTLWDNDRLRHAELIEPFRDLDAIAGRDAERLRDLGIEVVRVIGLSNLASELEKSEL